MSDNETGALTKLEDEMKEEEVEGTKRGIYIWNIMNGCLKLIHKGKCKLHCIACK